MGCLGVLGQVDDDVGIATGGGPPGDRRAAAAARAAGPGGMRSVRRCGGAAVRRCRELSVAEQRYQAVLAVSSDGDMVSEVAARFGVSWQPMHAWLGKYEAGGAE